MNSCICRTSELNFKNYMTQEKNINIYLAGKNDGWKDQVRSSLSGYDVGFVTDDGSYGDIIIFNFDIARSIDYLTLGIIANMGLRDSADRNIRIFVLCRTEITEVKNTCHSYENVTFTNYMDELCRLVEYQVGGLTIWKHGQYLDQLRELKDGWIAPGISYAPNRETLDCSETILNLIAKDFRKNKTNLPKMELGPIPAGGIQIRITIDAAQMNICLFNDGTFDVEEGAQDNTIFNMVYTAVAEEFEPLIITNEDMWKRYELLASDVRHQVKFIDNPLSFDFSHFNETLKEMQLLQLRIK